MSKTRIIAELGSCHMGKLERIKEAIDICKDLDLELKLQLFPNEAPYVPTNVYLEPELFTQAFEYAENKGVVLSSSVFDQASYDFLLSHRPRYIKFAYSKKNQTEWIDRTLREGIEAVVSADIMTDSKVPVGATKLYCIPEYPVRYEVSFDELFTAPQVGAKPRFDGFSDHTLGIRQTQRAIDAGAKIIEKHVRLGYGDEVCPDAFFAVSIRDLGKLRRS